MMAGSTPQKSNPTSGGKFHMAEGRQKERGERESKRCKRKKERKKEGNHETIKDLTILVIVR